MITNQVLTNQIKPGSRQEPTKIERRTLLGGALAAILASSGRVMAEVRDEPNDPFILLLKGIYQPVPAGQGQPNFGLDPKIVDLDDGTYSRTKIYPIFGIPDSTDQDKAIGNFYFGGPNGNLCAYDLPGGAIAMQFLPVPALIPDTGSGNSLGYNDYSTVAHPDGMGGQYDEGTFELTILEATRIYRDFAGGHNHMLAKTHQLVAGPVFANFPSAGYDEFCFCNISQYQFP
jgi:hypothetical protein